MRLRSPEWRVATFFPKKDLEKWQKYRFDKGEYLAVFAVGDRR